MDEIPKLKKTIWDYMVYTGLAILTLWLILKSIGVINTPLWLEYGVPIGSFVFAFYGFYQGIIDKFLSITANYAGMEEHLKHLDKDLESVRKDVEIVKTDLNLVKNNTGFLKHDMAFVKKDITLLKRAVKAQIPF